MKIRLIIFILFCLSESSLWSQEFCRNRNYFTEGCIRLESDSFTYTNEGDFDNFKFAGPLEIKQDTIILNIGVFRDSITVLESSITKIEADSIEIFIVLPNGEPIDYYEGWTNDTIVYMGFINGKIKLSEIPTYDTLIVNPYGAREYWVNIPIQGILKMGYQYKFVIHVPDEYLGYMQVETRFIRKGNKLIQIDENGKLGTEKWKKNGS